MKIVKSILLLMVAIFVTGCLDEPDCNSSTTNFVKVKFYNIGNNEADTLVVNSVTEIKSSNVLVNDTTASLLILPVRPDTLQTTFAFDTEFGIDTLVIQYNINTRLVSEDCGMEMIFSDLNYSRSDFDSVKVINRILVEGATEDVKIYN